MKSKRPFCSSYKKSFFFHFLLALCGLFVLMLGSTALARPAQAATPFPRPAIGLEVDYPIHGTTICFTADPWLTTDTVLVRNAYPTVSRGQPLLGWCFDMAKVAAGGSNNDSYQQDGDGGLYSYFIVTGKSILGTHEDITSKNAIGVKYENGQVWTICGDIYSDNEESRKDCVGPGPQPSSNQALSNRERDALASTFNNDSATTPNLTVDSVFAEQPALQVFNVS